MAVNPWVLWAAVGVLFVCACGYFGYRATVGRDGFGGRGHRHAVVARKNLVLLTSAPIGVVQASLAARIRADWAAHSPGATLVQADSPFRVVYRHLEGRNAGFIAVVTYQHLGPQELRAVASVESWHRNPVAVDGNQTDIVVAFMDVVVGAFQSVDPLVQVSR